MSLWEANGVGKTDGNQFKELCSRNFLVGSRHRLFYVLGTSNSSGVLGMDSG